MNPKKACAKAAMEYIANGMVIGLGGGIHTHEKIITLTC